MPSPSHPERGCSTLPRAAAARDTLHSAHVRDHHCASPETIRRLRPALGCQVRIAATGDDHAQLALAVDAAYDAIEHVEQALSFHRADSELHRLHGQAGGATVKVSDELWTVLHAARDFWLRSGGVFDPSVAAALVRDGQLPAPRDLPQPDRHADYGSVELPARGLARLARPLWLDFGGIAKGHAVDRALAVLKARGAHSACVNAGGDLACYGEAQRVALRDPRAPAKHSHELQLHDAACATSGAYFQPGMLRNARGTPARRRHGSVSVIAPDCISADALTKIVWLAPRRATALLDACAARCITLDARGHARGFRMMCGHDA